MALDVTLNNTSSSRLQSAVFVHAIFFSPFSSSCRVCSCCCCCCCCPVLLCFFCRCFFIRGPEVNYIHSVFNIECALDYVISSCINMHATNKDIRFDSIYYSYKNSI